ncbi:Lysophospholipase L1 [Pseudarcicella hirudinis]|uniref:Lysophospholipase L1 n=2 Tax=Pseudarcicella hirudinis TaxID=1079859 RepID=A0A1I5X917_9BACT|nr:Lysophospholipase L1 [Pseudarcicella hirudinis]
MTRFPCFSLALLFAGLIFLKTLMPQSQKSVMISQAPSGKSFLALGDSYTIGESVENKDRWSVQLTQLLRKDSVFIQKHDIIARSGWTTAELIEGIKQRKITETYDMVALLIGVNNQYRSQSVETYRWEFRKLLKICSKFTGNKESKVMVLSIPDWGVTPFARNRDKNQLSREIDEFNNVAREECGNFGITFIDITSISRQQTGPEMIASDNLHFSGLMYGLWAQKALETAKQILK